MKTFYMSKQATLYGHIAIGEGSIIEAGVVLGHPSSQSVLRNKKEINTIGDVDKFYSAISKMGVIIGKNSIVRSGTIIYEGAVIGDDFECGHNVLIRENVSIGNDVYLKSYAEVMKNVKIGSSCRIAGTVADNTIIGNNVSSFGFLTHKYAKHYTPEMAKIPGPVIRDGCIIGRNAVVIGDGVVLAENTTVGANTFVNYSTKENSVIIGFKGIEVTKKL